MAVNSGKLRAGQIAGVPNTHIVPLVSVQTTEGLEPVIGATGIYCGILAEQDGTITYQPFPAPALTYSEARVYVEFTDYSDDEAETLAAFSIRYLDHDGRTQEILTEPLLANGDVAAFSIPAEHTKSNKIFAASLRVSLHSFNNDDDTKRPVLIRGAWISFPA